MQGECLGWVVWAARALGWIVLRGEGGGAGDEREAGVGVDEFIRSVVVCSRPVTLC